MLFGDQVAEILVKDGKAVQLDRPRLGDLLALGVFLAGAQLQLDLVAVGDEGLHLLLSEQIDHVGILGLGLLFAAEHRKDRRGEDDQDQYVKADLPASVAFRFQMGSLPICRGMRYLYTSSFSTPIYGRLR